MKNFLIALILLVSANIFTSCIDNYDEDININSETVYITKTGDKYHKDGCHYLKDSRIPISLNDAIYKGYSKCSYCWKNSNYSDTPNTSFTFSPTPSTPPTSSTPPVQTIQPSPNKPSTINSNNIIWILNNNIIAYRTDANYSKLDFKSNDIWKGESSNGIDNNLSSILQNCWWVNSNSDVWHLEASFYYDLKNNVTLNEFTFYGASGYPYSSVDDFQLYYSNNPLNDWKLALNVKMPTIYSMEWHTFNFPQQTARYWKLVAKPTDKAYEIKEIGFGKI